MPDLGDAALRCLLALLHESFRFDPEEDRWVHPGRWFDRKTIQDASGLSDQGTRNGLTELEEEGWTDVDRSGRSHRHRLLLCVPTRRFTYVPTALLERASRIDSGTELRVVLAVLRCTWGWTTTVTAPASGQTRVEHDRWAQLSYGALAATTGRSETAVRNATEALQGRWIERVRPGTGAYQYRFLPEAVMGEESSFSGDIANDLPPDRQRGGRSSSSKESSTHRHAPPRRSNSEPTTNRGTVAVPSHDNNAPTPRSSENPSPSKNKNGRQPEPDLGDLPPEKRKLAQTLANVGVWPGRITEVLNRYTEERIRANFELYRARDAQETISRPGAWLYAAITQGYALPGSDAADGSESASEGAESQGAHFVSTLEHKDMVTEAEMEAYVAGGVDRDCFHRCLSGEEGEARYMYFDPEIGGPARRV